MSDPSADRPPPVEDSAADAPGMASDGSNTLVRVSEWARLTVDRPVATIMVVVAVVVFGWVSLQRLPVNLMPPIDYPTVTVRTAWSGAAPEEIEDTVVAPIEELVGTVEGLVGLRSVSRAGSSDVVLQFAWGTDLDRATQKVRERLSLLNFAEGVETPQVLRYDPALDPILRLAVRGDARPAVLRRYAEEELKREIEKIPGVAMARVLGGEEEIIRVAVDERRLQALGLSITALGSRLSSENVNVAGGLLADGEVEYLVRTLNEFRTLDDLRRLTIGGTAERPIHLEEIATVSRAPREREVVTRLGGQESIEIAVFKEADANLVAVAEAVRLRVFGADGALDAEGSGAEAASEASAMPVRAGSRPMVEDLPPGLALELLRDQSTYIRAAIAEVVSTALVGGVCAVLVLLFFLRNAYATLVIGLAIPLSVLATFAPLRGLGVSLNVMSLGGLALGIGMLVDNAIVVLESIVRCREEGDPPLRAAIRGASEVGGAVVASTLTTVAVFAPIAFVDGVAGRLFGDLAVAVVLSLLASLVFALFFVPMMAALPARIALGTTEARAQRDAENPAVSTVREPDETRVDAPWWHLDAWRVFRRDIDGLRTRWQDGGVLMRALLIVAGPLWVVWSGLRLVLGTTLEVTFVWVLGSLMRGLLWVLVQLARTGAIVLRTLMWPLFWAFDRLLAGVGWLYRGVLRAALGAPLVVIAMVAGLGWWAYGGWQGLGRQLIPELSQGEFGAVLKLPVGTGMPRTLQMVARVEDELTGEPSIRQVSSFVGRRVDDLDASEQGEHYAELTVLVTPSEDPAVTEATAMAAVRRAVADEPGLSVELTRPSLFAVEAPLVIEVRGYRLDALGRTAERVAQAIRGVDGVTDVRTSTGQGYPEVRIRFDRARLLQYGLDVREVAETVRDKVSGRVVTDVREEARSVDVELLVRRDDVSTVEDLGRIVVGQARAADGMATAGAAVPGGMDLGGLGGAQALARGGNEGGAPTGGTTGTPVTLAAVATIELAEGPAEVRRVDGQRAAEITAATSLLDLGRVAQAVATAVSSVTPEPGQVIFVGGQSQEMELAAASLTFALLLALFLVYVVLASTFESFVGPMVILTTVPFALVGVVGILHLLQTPVSVVVFIGVIVLAGIVVNNAIVLVDYALQLERRGLSRRAAIEAACAARLRPVLITAATTVLGLLPMALATGEGAEIRRPLAWVVGAGLASSTILTLVVVPVALDRTGALVDFLARLVGRHVPAAVGQPSEIEDKDSSATS